MSKLENINNKLSQEGIFLTLEKSSRGYYFFPNTGEQTIYFSAYEFMNCKFYKNLNKSFKSWLRSAKALDRVIKKNMR